MSFLLTQKNPKKLIQSEIDRAVQIDQGHKELLMRKQANLSLMFPFITLKIQKYLMLPIL